MRPRLLPLLAASALAASLLGPVSVRAEEPEDAADGSGSTATAPDATAAQEILEQARALFEDRPAAARQRATPAVRRDATLLLTLLARVRPELDAAGRRQADALLARPTSRRGGAAGDRYTVAEEPPVCGPTVCVHYVATTVDAPSLADGNEDDVPDYVTQTLQITEKVNGRYVAAGYRRPDSDGQRGGRTDRVDVYLSDMGDLGLYGYCASDQRGAPHRWAYCGIDDDFSPQQFGRRNAPLDNLRVTLAHEYFHAIQFGYDFGEDLWLMEASATWAEDELFDGIDDNRQYLVKGQLRRPGVPLDQFGVDGNHYGNWIFLRRLTERFNRESGGMPVLVRDLWRRLGVRQGQPDDYSTQGLQAVLGARGTGFARAYADFAVANRRPARSYAEGAAYPTARPTTFDVGPGARLRRTTSFRTSHLTHRVVRFDPDGTRGPRWRLRLGVDLPGRATAPAARVLVFGRDGRVGQRVVRLSRSGGGRVTVPFAAAAVARVEVVVVNASRRTRCGTRSPFACAGSPTDDRLPVTVTARAVRG